MEIGEWRSHQPDLSSHGGNRREAPASTDNQATVVKRVWGGEGQSARDSRGDGSELLFGNTVVARWSGWLPKRRGWPSVGVRGSL